MARTLETPFGSLTFRTQSTGRVSLGTTGPTNERMLINGIDYQASGVFDLVERQWGTFVTFTHYNGLEREMTDNARRKLTDWASERWIGLYSPEEEHAEQIRSVQWRIDRAVEDVSEAQSKLDALRAELAAL